jgi:ArsR family transcriptional regulator, arsenate/arsenite/antimonite-responsive transcriptional repressor
MAKRSDRYDFPRFFKTFSERPRLRLLNLVREGDVCLCHLADVTGLSEATAARHLGIAHRSGLVRVQLVNRRKFYHLSVPLEPSAAEMLNAVLKLMDEDAEMRADRAALSERLTDPLIPAYCPPPGGCVSGT